MQGVKATPGPDSRSSPERGKGENHLVHMVWGVEAEGELEVGPPGIALEVARFYCTYSTLSIFKLLMTPTGRESK